MRKSLASSLLAVTLVTLPGTTTPVFAQDSAQEREDRGFLAGLLEDNLSGAGRAVVIDGFRGALSSRATIDRMTIADDQGIWLTLNNITLDWNRAALLLGRVSVNELKADEIIIARKPVVEESADIPSAEATPFALPELPVSVNIGQLTATRIELGEPILGEALEGRLEAQASLAGGDGQVSLLFERTDTGPAGVVKLSGSYANATRQLALDLEASEGEGGITSRLMGLPGTPSVDLAVKGMGPLDDFAATLNLSSDGQPRLEGSFSLKGTDDGAQGFVLDLGGDVAPLFLPEYATFFGDSIHLKTEGARSAQGVLTLDTLDLETRALNLQGSGTIAADGMPEKLDLALQMGLGDGTAVLLPIGGEGKTYVDSADLTMRFDAGAGSGWRTSGHLLGLRLDAMTSSRIEFLGTGQIARDPEGNRVDGKVIYGVHDLVMADPSLAQALGGWLNGHVVFDWQQGGDGLRLPEIVVRGDGRRLDGSVTVTGLSSTMEVASKAQVQLTDLSQFSDLAGRPLSGSGTFALDGSLTPLSGAFDGQVTVDGQDLALGIEQVDNLLKGASHVSVSALRDESGTTLRSLEATARTLQLSGSGKAASLGTDLTLDLAFSDLSVLGGGYGGGLQGKARVTGTVENGTLTLDATGTYLAINQPEADALLRGQTLLGITITRAGEVIRIDRADIQNPQAEVSATGTVTGTEDPVFDLAAQVRAGNLSVIGRGYRGALDANASVKGTMANAQLLANATGTNLAIGQAQADRLLAGNSTLSADLALVDGALRINNARVQNPQLSVEATGHADGNARRIELNARLANLAILQPELPGAVTVTGTAIEDASGTRLDISATGPGQIDARLQGTLAPGYGGGDLTVRGSAQAVLANAFLDPRAISGLLNYDLRLNGPLQLTSVSGRVTLANGRVVDPDLAFAIERLNVTANLSGGQVRLNADAGLSTEGRLTASGTIGLQAPYNADLVAEAKWALLRDPSLYEVRTNGRVTIRGPLTGGAMIAGRIDVVEAELRIPSTGFGGIGAIPDLRHFNEPVNVRRTRSRAGADAVPAAASSASSTSRPFGLDLRIIAPNRMFIRGRGLDAELGGALHLTGTTANVIPSGGFQLIRGRLDILGRRLDLSEATMQMEGNFVPDLTIVATSQSDDIAVSVRIEGPATDPDVTFTSSPELPQEEVLARLLFNRGLENISALQAAQLANAVMNLAGGGAVGVVDRLRTGFGLDNLDVQMDGTGGASVAAGKYLSKNLYTEVGVDQKGDTTLNLNLDVSRSVTVRARAASDGDSGLGVFFERNY